MSFIKELTEARALRTKRGLNLSAEQIAENIYLTVLSLQAMRFDSNTAAQASEYAKKTLQYQDFSNIRSTATDLHNWVAVFNNSERYATQIGPVGRASMPVLQFKRYLRDVAQGKNNPNFDKQFLMSLERNLGVRNGQYSATRRLLSDWNRLYGSERKLGTTRLLHALRAKTPKSDLRGSYEGFMRKGGYELKDVKNLEKRGMSGLMKTALTVGAGFIAGKEIAKRLPIGLAATKAKRNARMAQFDK